MSQSGRGEAPRVADAVGTDEILGAPGAAAASRMFDRVAWFRFLGPGPGQGRIRNRGAGPGGPRLSHVVSSGHEIGLAVDGSWTLVFPLSGRIESCVSGHDARAVPGQVMLLGPGMRRTRVVPEARGPYRALVLLLPDPPRAAPLTPVGVLAEEGMAAAARLRAALAEALADAPGPTAPDAAGALAGMAEEILAAADPRRGRRGRARLAAAETFLREAQRDPVRMPEAARAASVSLRQLQALFRDRHGVGPQGFLTRLRLEAAHRDLAAAAGPSAVTRAALDAGFTHLGRFAAAYRRRFGQSPSVVARARPGGARPGAGGAGDGPAA